MTLLQVSFHSWVCGYIGETENQLLCISVKLLSDIINSFKQFVGRYFISEQEWVKTPNHTAFSQLLHQFFKTLYALVQSWNIWLYSLGLIVVKRELDVAPNPSLFELIEKREERLRILRPEDNESRVGK